MKQDTYVRITKISNNTATSSNPNIEPGYWTEGYLSEDIEVGNHVWLDRLCNSVWPDGCLGIFNTSTVKSFQPNDQGLLVRTANSLYQVTEVEPRRLDFNSPRAAKRLTDMDGP